MGNKVELTLDDVVKASKQKSYKLSPQAVGAVMLALQRGILEKVDITDMLRGFELVETKGGLVVSNPPSCKVPEGFE